MQTFAATLSGEGLIVNIAGVVNLSLEQGDFELAVKSEFLKVVLDYRHHNFVKAELETSDGSALAGLVVDGVDNAAVEGKSGLINEEVLHGNLHRFFAVAYLD